MKSILGLGMLALGLAAGGAAKADNQHDENGVDKGKIHHRMNDGAPELNPGATATVGEALTAGSTATSTRAISNHGGPVMGGAPDIHLIWYGNWAQANGSDTAAGQQIAVDFMNTVGGSNWIKINTATPATGNKGYTGSGGTAVSGNLARVVSSNFGYLSGKKSLTDANIATVVANYVATQGGASTNAIYFVLTSSDVTASSGFCTQYCGWHTKGTVAGVANVKYSFVGNANRCLASCAPQTTSPNGNAGVDGMVSVLAHELVETLSDPLLNAWYDNQGAENADKCAWTFGGAQQLAANGSFYNVTLGARKFAIQRNLAVNSKCYVDAVTGQQ
jgi:hypothetical protein